MAEDSQTPDTPCDKKLPWWTTSFQNVLTLVVIFGSGYIWITQKDSETRSMAASMITMVLGYHYGRANRNAPDNSR